MIYIIIGIIIIFSIIILFYILDRILDCGLLDDPVLYIYAILFGIVCSCTIYGVKAPSMLQYEAYTENYELKKIMRISIILPVRMEIRSLYGLWMEKDGRREHFQRK